MTPQPGAVDGEPEPVTARTEPAPGTRPLPAPVAEATHAEPDTAKPVEVEPMAAEPTAVEPTTVELVTTEQPTTEPAEVEPVKTEPAKVKVAEVEVAEPVAAEAVAGEPVAGDRVEPAAEPADPADDQIQPVQPTAGNVPAEADTTAGQHDTVVTPRDAEDGPDDDFRRIQGIGPKIAAALQAAGIRTYRQLAERDEAGLREVIRGAGLRAAPGLASWPQQARILADAPAEADKVFPAPTA
ncbi:hypothetical protein AB0H63_28245 [Micromonospora echinospora]